MSIKALSVLPDPLQLLCPPRSLSCYPPSTERGGSLVKSIASVVTSMTPTHWPGILATVFLSSPPAGLDG